MRTQILRLYKDLLRYGQNLEYTDSAFFKRRVKERIEATERPKSGLETGGHFSSPATMKRSKVLLEMFFDLKIPMSFSLPSVSALMLPRFNPARSMSLKKYLDYSKVPKLNEADVEIQFVRGSGPGGQATNKTSNAVVLKHLPTGIVVKNHATRSMWENKKLAMETMVTRLDNLINGEESIEAQIKNYQAKKSADRSRKKKKLDELKAAFKEREGL